MGRDKEDREKEKRRDEGGIGGIRESGGIGRTETRGGIQERTVGLRFLGIISRVLRLEVSTLVLCLSTRCSS